MLCPVLFWWNMGLAALLETLPGLLDLLWLALDRLWALTFFFTRGVEDMDPPLWGAAGLWSMNAPELAILSARSRS